MLLTENKLHFQSCGPGSVTAQLSIPAKYWAGLLFLLLFQRKLDPFGSTVHYEVIKLCTGSVQDSNGWYLAVLSQYEAVIDVIGSVEGIYVFIY